MLTLLTFKPMLGLRAPSPFALKADALLTMSGLDFTREYFTVIKAPRKKLPVLRDGDHLIPDSALIQRHLENEHMVDFDGHLTQQELATATAFRRLVEHHLYFIAAWFRWEDYPNDVKDAYLQDIPKPLRGLFFSMALKQFRKTLHLQGLSRHTREDLVVFAKEDIGAIASQLGEKTWFMGEQLSSIDASVAGALENNLNCTLEAPLTEAIKAHPNLVAYCQRFRGELYGEA
ncbi:MAG: glutathione S-transferase family protein [Pseudomonadota bacterium]